MPTPVNQKITAWSYSRWNDYSSCPAKAKYKHIDKLKEPGSPQMDRGIRIHKLAEDWVKGKGKDLLPPELLSFAEEFDELLFQDPICEQDLAFDKDWQPTGWFEKNVWVRIKMDVRTRIGTDFRVIDYKTGKQNPAHTGQLTLYAVGGFITEENAKSINAELWYPDYGLMSEAKFHRAQLASLKGAWELKVTPMLADTEFIATPSIGGCKWCHFRKSNHGPCPHEVRS